MALPVAAVLLVSLLLGLLGVYWLLRRNPKTKTSTGDRKALAATTSTSSADGKAKPLPPGHPSPDPIHQFAAGEREDVPFSCPFMAAFKEAQKREKAEAPKDASASSALDQFNEIMAGYEEFKRQKESSAAKSEDDDSEVTQSSLVGHIKRLEQEKLILQLTEEEMQEEENARRSQLAEIYSLMEAQKDKFGINSVNEMHKQMRLYVS